MSAMQQPSPGPVSMRQDESETSLFALAAVLVRWRRTIITLAVLGGLLGLARGMISRRVYTSNATFIPQRSEGSVSGLALAASQFGIRVPTAGDVWGPPLYVELLRSQSLLDPIAHDTVVVTEEGGRHVALMDLLRIEDSVPERRADVAVRALRGIVTANEVKALGAVRVSVTTRWPSVSLTLAEDLLRAVNQFDAERLLRAAEDRLQVFLQRNRAFAGSPELNFEHDRLQREVALRQQVYTSLLQSREEARMREVRDTPVITVLENPRLPVVGESRRSIAKSVLGGFAGSMLGIIIALLAHGASRARQETSGAARDFFRLLDEVTPGWLKRGAS